jgi:tetratricopeptide (TPR) repeat protein
VALRDLRGQQGDVEGARAPYQQAIDSGHAGWAPEAAVSLARLLAGQGDVEGARAAYQQAIDSRHADWAPEAACALRACWLAEQEDMECARAAHQQAIDSGRLPGEVAGLRSILDGPGGAAGGPGDGSVTPSREGRFLSRMPSYRSTCWRV